MTIKPDDENVNDSDVFSQAMKGVTKLSSDKYSLDTKPKNRVMQPLPTVEEKSEQPSFAVPNFQESTAGSYNHGATHKQFKLLKQGKLASVEDELDIHGLTLAQGAEVLAEFLYSRQEAGMRLLRIVHGQGRDPSRPSLKQCLHDACMAHTDLCLAYAEAPPSMGGLGATLILLRKNG